MSCIQLRKAGYVFIINPFLRLIHYLAQPRESGRGQKACVVERRLVFSGRKCECINNSHQMVPQYNIISLSHFVNLNGFKIFNESLYLKPWLVSSSEILLCSSVRPSAARNSIAGRGGLLQKVSCWFIFQSSRPQVQHLLH